MKRFIWISYDLGVRGDYEGLYTWLDEHAAKECGDSIAALSFEVKKNLLTELETQLRSAFQTNRRTRIYVIYQDPATKQMKGRFLFGGRRAPPWTGYAIGPAEEDEGGV